MTGVSRRTGKGLQQPRRYQPVGRPLEFWASAFDTFPPDLALGAPRTFKASATIDF